MESRIFDTTYEYGSLDGKTRINARVWSDVFFGDPGKKGVAKPKAIVQIIHGMTEHIDRYDRLARFLVKQGFIVCAEDHVGHGKSAANPGERGHIPILGGKDILIGDVHSLHSLMAGIFPGVPYVLYGHSMGSFIARAYIARYGESLAACVLSGTGSVPVALSKAGRLLATSIAKVKGETYRSKFIDSMGAGGYSKQIENARTPFDWLSTADAVVDEYIADENCGYLFTVGGYAALLDLTAEIATDACAARVPKQLPVLFVAGDGDPVGDMGKGVYRAAKLLRKAGVEDVTEIIYPGMRHEVHNEIGFERVYHDIAAWIQDRVE